MAKSKPLNSKTLKEIQKARKIILEDRKLNHLLVDLDGTLLDAHERLSQIDFLSKAIPEMSRLTEKSWYQILKAMRNVQKEVTKPNTPHGPNMRTRVAMAVAHALGLTVEVSDQVIQTMLQTVFPTIQRHFFPVPGAKDFVDWAKDHYPMILATNPIWTEEYVRMRLDWAQIPVDYFKWVSYSDIMWDLKPRSRYYQDVLAREHLDATNCLLIGNDPKRDVPAVQVGISVFLLSREDECVPLKTGPDQAPAWRGSYRVLRKLLDKESNIG